jgi:hypothetical protein
MILEVQFFNYGPLALIAEDTRSTRAYCPIRPVGQSTPDDDPWYLKNMA